MKIKYILLGIQSIELSMLSVIAAHSIGHILDLIAIDIPNQPLKTIDLVWQV